MPFRSRSAGTRIVGPRARNDDSVPPPDAPTRAARRPPRPRRGRAGAGPARRRPGARPRGGRPVGPPGHPRPAWAARSDPRPSIVMVLMDDASYELLSTMRQAQRMRTDGATYTDAHVVDSLCCPSRAAILTGRTASPDRRAGQHRERPAHPVGGSRRVRRPPRRTPGPSTSRCRRPGTRPGSSASTSTGTTSVAATGTWSHRRRSRGGTPSTPSSRGGYPEWGFRSAVQSAGGRMRLAKESEPPRTASTAVLDRHYATNVAGKEALRFIRPTARRPPLLPRGGDLRAARRAGPRLPGQPCVPERLPGPGEARPPTSGNCGARSCASLTTATSGVRRPAGRQPPRLPAPREGRPGAGLERPGRSP